MVRGRTGSTFDSLDNILITDIGFPAVITMDAEVIGIVESVFVMPME